MKVKVKRIKNRKSLMKVKVKRMKNRKSLMKVGAVKNLTDRPLILLCHTNIFLFAVEINGCI